MQKKQVMLTVDYASDTFWDQPIAQIQEQIAPHYIKDETELLQQLLALAELPAEQLTFVTKKATTLIETVRASKDAIHIIDALLQQYSLSTQEGILLMCLAEALMRVPDTHTAEALIDTKISSANWKQHLNKSNYLLINASTWGLMLTGKITQLNTNDISPSGVIGRLTKKMGVPVIRTVINQAMKIMGKHFVLGRTIEEALIQGKKCRSKGYNYSFDMLGEAALTAIDAKHYLKSYMDAITTIAKERDKYQLNERETTVSIKLSALHPRYDILQKERVLTELFDTLLTLLEHARRLKVGITIDAEESDRLEISLQLFEKLYRHPITTHWGYFGLVVQTYSKRAFPVLIWLNTLAREVGDIIPLRLVKGAYWDSEIKWAQQKGIDGYPVFTRKEATDVSYLACAHFLLNDATRGFIYPQFATHNAHTIASVLTMAELSGRTDDFEFQRLHGMGEVLYDIVMEKYKIPMRVYAPVGNHKDLLPYLVRRLLENGANSSFVHRLSDAKTPISSLVQHPTTLLKGYGQMLNQKIPLPPNLFNDRRNSEGLNIRLDDQWHSLQVMVTPWMKKQWELGPIINGQLLFTNHKLAVHTPYNLTDTCGTICWADRHHVEQALNCAYDYFETWNATSVDHRASLLEVLADKLEDNKAELIALCHREAGKTVQDSIDEIREAVDFCRYYAQMARNLFANPQLMPGPTGESNVLQTSGRGVFLCISPWNFPLAIFLGQITAALVTGNTVIAKPAEQTGLIAAITVNLMLEAGFPPKCIQLLPGEGKTIGAALVCDLKIAGVTFTGSIETATGINRSLASRDAAIIPLIAETGGQNAMIVDSTALPEQVVQDVIRSAFISCGQRCSALRVLYIQDEIYEKIIDLLKGAMSELKIGDPSLQNTDIGPVIDGVAKERLMSYIANMKSKNFLIYEYNLPDTLKNGHFVAPIVFELENINQLKKEHFGPILHIIRYKSKALPNIIEDINGTGFGLTLCIHTRNEKTADYIIQRAKAGNIYINRDQIGATVGVQPFGGTGLSGTGPKAGGPLYLHRFITERTITTNTTAMGGNATLLSLER